MKSLIAAFLVSAVSITASAKASKVCFGQGDTKGAHFEIEISRHQIVISETSGEGASGYEGSYKYVGHITGRDGKTYNEFPTNMCDEGCTSILVEDSLSDAGEKGTIKIRWRGESFQEAKFFCRDSK